MKEQFLETWRIHQRMNELVINNTTAAGMDASLSTRGGRTVFQQWIHVHQVRLHWLEVCAKDLFAKETPLEKDMPVDNAKLLATLDHSAKALMDLFDRGWEEGGKVNGFKKGVVPLMGYFISHESHHRGNILLTLKKNGEPLPDALKWGLWEWGK